MKILKNSCPFCGGTRLRVFLRRTRGMDIRYLAQVHCMVCGARGPVAQTPKMDWRDHLSKKDELGLQELAIELFQKLYEPPKGELF